MSDPLDRLEADWRRRRDIARRWGGGSGSVALVALLIYWAMMAPLPASPIPETGNVFAIINFAGRHSPIFKYATQMEFIAILTVIVVMIVSLVTTVAVVYHFTPGVFLNGDR